MKESWPLYRLQLYTFPFIRSYTLHYHTSHLTLFFNHSNLLAYTSSRLFHTLYCSVQTVDSKYFKILILHLLYFCSFIVASPFHLYLSLTHTHVFCLAAADLHASSFQGHILTSLALLPRGVPTLIADHNIIFKH